MTFTSAILAAIIWQTGLARVDVLDEPLRVGFRLVDGVKITGQLAEWDRDGFDGSFGRRFWFEIHPDDTWLLVRRIVDRDSPTGWIDAGSLLLRLEGLNAQAEYAFRRAAELDPQAGEAIELARAEAVESRRARIEEEANGAGDLLAVTTPEAQLWPTDVWPPLSVDQQRASRLSVLADLEAMLGSGPVAANPVETEFFLVYTDAPRLDAARWAVHLDHHYRWLADLMKVDPEENVFWGKAAVVIFKDRSDFAAFEVREFNHQSPGGQIAVTHFKGPKIFITAALSRDGVEFEAALAHEMTHGFMHRYETPHRLPAWANEGLADFTAQQVLDESDMHDGLRPVALELIRGGYPTTNVLEMTYAEGSFPGPRKQGQAIAPMLVEHLLRQSHAGFVEWVRSVKGGADWREAMQQVYRGTSAQFADSFYRFYRVND